MLESTGPSSLKVQTIMYRNHPHQCGATCVAAPAWPIPNTRYSNSACTHEPPAITTGSSQSASDRMCRRSLGCIPPGVATQPDLGRSDFAISLPQLAPRPGR